MRQRLKAAMEVCLVPICLSCCEPRPSPVGTERCTTAQCTARIASMARRREQQSRCFVILLQAKPGGNSSSSFSPSKVAMETAAAARAVCSHTPCSPGTREAPAAQVSERCEL